MHAYAYYFLNQIMYKCKLVNYMFALVKPPLRGVTLAEVIGIVHPKMNPHPQFTQDVDAFFCCCCFLIGTLLKTWA